MEEEKTPSLCKDDEVQMTCVAIGEKGDGVCKHKGFVVFVPHAEADKTYLVRITRILPKVGFGEIINEV